MFDTANISLPLADGGYFCTLCRHNVVNTLYFNKIVSFLDICILSNCHIGCRYINDFQPRLSFSYWRYQHGMPSRARVTVGHLSVRLSVCPIVRQQQRWPAGLLLSVLWTEDIDRQLPASALRISCRRAQQQRRRSTTALSSKCGQCHVDSRGTRLNNESQTCSACITVVRMEALRHIVERGMSDRVNV